jgi:orotidine-5'-phosphate decarboxylase
MTQRTHAFADRLLERILALGNLGCVGLDPVAERLPSPLRPAVASPEGWALAYEAFGRGVIAAAAGRVPAIKPQVAFFEALGSPGVAALERLVGEARRAGLVVVLDAKRGDIGNTAEAYARATLDPEGPVGADAVTLNPYLGPESMSPFLKWADRGCGVFVLVRTSNPGAERYQRIGVPSVAEAVAEWINTENAARVGLSGYGPVGAVLGATLGAELGLWRERLPQSFVLVPGYGAQGGDLEAVKALLDRHHNGILVVAARAVLWPRDGVDGPGWEGALAARIDGFVDEICGTLGVPVSPSRADWTVPSELS